MECLSVCPCVDTKSAKARLKNNSFENFRNNITGGYSTLEGKCELIGFKYCEMVDKKEITLDKIIDDIITFSKIHAEQTEGVQLSWLALHLALGILYQYKVYEKKKIREVLREMIVYSRGIDMGLYMRDMLHYQDYSSANEVVDKSLYCLYHCAGFKVDLKKDGLADRIFVGPSRVHFRELVNLPWCYYFQLPTGHPTLSMSGANTSDHVGNTSLFLACENLKPALVLCLLQHGASPHGKPIEYLLGVLGSHKLVSGMVTEELADAPIEIIQECLKYCLRVVPRLNVRFDGQVVADLRRQDDAAEVYFLNEKAAVYMPDDMYKTPASLKHMSRCSIRSTLLENDHIPEGIEKLPNLNPDVSEYLRLKV